jgi:hypothetical protein
MKTKVLFLIMIFIQNINFAQKSKCPKNAIIYEVPYKIQVKLDSAAKKYSDNYTKKYSFFYISNNSHDFSINFHSSNSLDERQLKLYKLTKRYLHVKGSYYEVFLSGDYLLSSIVNVREKNGYITTVSYSGASYFISFKLLGLTDAEIIEEGNIQ